MPTEKNTHTTFYNPRLPKQMRLVVEEAARWGVPVLFGDVDEIHSLREVPRATNGQGSLVCCFGVVAGYCPTAGASPKFLQGPNPSRVWHEVAHALEWLRTGERPEQHNEAAPMLALEHELHQRLGMDWDGWIDDFWLVDKYWPEHSAKYRENTLADAYEHATLCGYLDDHGKPTYVAPLKEPRQHQRALTWEQAQELRILRKNGWLLRELQAWSGLSETAVRNIIAGKTYKTANPAPNVA